MLTAVAVGPYSMRSNTLAKVGAIEIPGLLYTNNVGAIAARPDKHDTWRSLDDCILIKYL